MAGDRVTHGAIKRSITHFAVGKVVSSLIGLGLLLLLVRALPRSDYGAYIALLAIFEIAQLATNLGAFAAAFRYVPELRATGSPRQLSRFVMALALYRTATLLLAALLLFVLAQPLAELVGLTSHASAIRLFSAVLLFEGVARFLDVLFDSLFLQGYAQVSLVIRNGIRLCALVVMLNAGVGGISLEQWIPVEAAASAVGCVIGFFLLVRYCRSRPGSSDSPASPPLTWNRIVRFAVPSYVAQILGLVSGPDVVKLIVSRLAGLIETAAFGFAAALSATIQRYMPAFLLVGMIRPLFVMAREQGKPSAELVRLAGTVLKLNLLTLGPVIACLVVAGPEIVDLLTAGKLPDSLPYIHFFMLFLVFQVVHAVIGLVGIVYEEGTSSLVGTLFGLLGLGVGLVGYPLFGVASLCAGLVMSEIAWCVTMVVSLKKRGVHFRLPTGLVKLLLSLVLAATPALLLLNLPDASLSRAWVLTAGTVAAASFLVLAAVLKPFEPDERDVINRLLPARVFIW